MFNQMTLYGAGAAPELQNTLTRWLLRHGVRPELERRGDDLEVRVEGGPEVVAEVLDQVPHWYAAWRRHRGPGPRRWITIVGWMGAIGCADGGAGAESAEADSAAPRPEASGSLTINEVQPHFEAGGDWIELYNGSVEPLRADGLVLEVSGLSYSLSLGELDPGAHVIVPCGRGAAVTEALDRNGDTVTLFAPGPEEELVVIDRISWNDVPIGTAYARIPDGDGHWTLVSSATPGEPNQVWSP